MPQMSPLMWSYLFILFSLLILASLIKIYFFTKKTILSEKTSYSKNYNLCYKWMW